MPIKIINIDFSDDEVIPERNYKEEINNVITELKMELKNLCAPSKTRKSFSYAESLVDNATKKAINIMTNMKNDLISKQFKLD
jgi:uncharacterized membrane-anchored protein